MQKNGVDVDVSESSFRLEWLNTKDCKYKQTSIDTRQQRNTL